MYSSRDLSMWVPSLILGLLFVAYGQGYAAISPLDVVPGLNVMLPLAGYSIALATFLGVATVAFSVVIVATMSDTEEGELLPSIASGFRALAFVGIVAIGWYFYSHLYESPTELALDLWWTVPLAFVGWLMFVYLQNRRQVATGTTAVNRTQRDVERSLNEWGELGSGTIALIVAGFLALLAGIMTGIANIGDPLLQFAPEAAYLMTIALGYVSLGGEFAYSWLFPDLTAIQFVAVSAAMAVVGIVVANR